MLDVIFIGITLLSFACVYLATGRDKSFLLFSLFWIGILSVLASQHFFENTLSTPPRFLLVLIVAIGLCVYFYHRFKNKFLSRNHLMAIHVLRVPIELVLFRLYESKEIPLLMTFEGWNFDIIQGIFAILILLYENLTKRQVSTTMFDVWNVVGLISLLTIVLIAILSAPLPIQQFAFDQPNVAVLKFPFIFLPAYIVPLVFLSHWLFLFSGKSDLKK